MRFTGSTLLWIPLLLVIAIIVVHKIYAVAGAVSKLPQSATEVLLHSVSLLMHIQLMRQQTWAWLMIFALNILTLGLALFLWGRMEWIVRPIAFQSIVMLILLYLNRRRFLARKLPLALNKVSDRPTEQFHW